MFYQRLAAAAPAAALLFAASAAAQTAPAADAPSHAEPAPAPATAGACCLVPARTQIEIEITDTINSRTSHTMQPFAFRLVAPLVIDGRIVVPAGTTGVGEVVHAARARAMGKAGELILAARYLDYNGAHIPLRTLRVGNQQGRDSSGTLTTLNVAAAATIPALSLVSFMIAGGEVNVPAGTHATAQISAETTLPPAP